MYSKSAARASARVAKSAPWTSSFGVAPDKVDRRLVATVNEHRIGPDALALAGKLVFAPPAIGATFVKELEIHLSEGQVMRGFAHVGHAVGHPKPRGGFLGERVVNKDGKAALFGEGTGANTRDPMVLSTGGRWHCYYTANPHKQGAVYCRTSPDLARWSESTTAAFGGQSGTGPYSAECPFVVSVDGHYYLFRTQHYGAKAQTSVYHSSDPLRFGINQDRLYFLGTLPVAAPEILVHEGQYYLAALRSDLQGIPIARLKWTKPSLR